MFSYLFVLCIEVVACFIGKVNRPPFAGSKNSAFVTGVANEIDSERVRQNIMDKLRTVETDPLYDYKDMWWKTIRKTANTESLKPDSTTKNKSTTTVTETTYKQLTTAVDLTTRINKLKLNQKRKRFGDVTGLKNNIPKSKFKKVKAMVKDDSGEKNKTLNIEDFIYNDVLIGNFSSAHNNFIEYKRNYTKDVSKDNMTNIYNSNKIFQEIISSMNKTQVNDFYNQSYPLYDSTQYTTVKRDYGDYGMKTTWHLFHSGKREWLLPFERPSPMPPYGLITTTEEPKDFITTLNHYKTTHSEGYFSTFLTYLFYVISEKPDRDVRLLSLAVAKEYGVLKNEPFISDFGPAFIKILKNFSVDLAESDPDYTKAYSYILYKSLPERKSTLAPGITYIIDFINTFFNVKEGLELFKALDNLNKFPNTTANAYEILRTLTKAIFAPYIRFTGTMKSRMLIESINNEIVRANDNEIVERAKSSKENVTNGTDLRRLGFFTNRTRFLVVDRKESDQSEDEENIIRNIQNKLRYTSNFIYEIKDAKKSNANVKLVKSSDETPVFTKRTTEYNPFQKHIARFKIVTRKTDSSKREKILSTTMTKSYKHKLKIKEKHSETFDNYVKFQKIQHDAKLQLGKVTKNYYMDKRIADDRYKQTTLKRKIFGRTIYHKPNVEIIKLSKAPTIDTHNKNRYITKTIGSKTNEAAHVTTKKKTVIPKNKRHKIPLKTFVLVNDFGRNPLKITSLIKNKNVKVYKPHAHGVTESKGDIDEKFKGRNSVLSKITAPTSYSYEEDELKFNINDAFKHNELYYKARQFDLNPERKEGINKLSSYSSEEAAIKSNLYKVIGFNHIVRNATFGHIYSR